MDQLKDEIVTSILRSSARPSPKTPNRRVSVHFPPPNNLKDILSRYSDDESRSTMKLAEEVEGIITHMHNLQGSALIDWLTELQENIPLLKPKLEPFVLSMLKISWASSHEKSVVSAFQNFLINLLSAHSFYTKPVIKTLMLNLIGKGDEAEEEARIFENTHGVIKTILKVSPLAGKREILNFARECMPYMLSPLTFAHAPYVRNLLTMSKYIKNERVTILRILIDRAVQLDVHIPKEVSLNDEDEEEDEAFEMDIEPRSQVKEDYEIARCNLDEMMFLLFNYIKDETSANDEDYTRALYFDFLNVFESHILPTYATGHVQFLMFYFISLSPPKYFGHFLDWLWKKFINPNTASILRQSAVSYIASLVARAKFINIGVAKTVLEKIVQWIHAYILAREQGTNGDFMYVDVKAHGSFYAACQSTLYIFAFRHEEFVQSRKLLAFLRGLNFSTIVTCHLNPLRVCLPPVVKNFASISRNYQLAYCDTIIQRNNRMKLPVVGNLSSTSGSGKTVLLDSFFPFDPYSLKKSKCFIEPLYRDYNANDEESDSEEEEEEEDEIEILEDEKMEDSVIGEESHDEKSVLQSFMYGTSPGFKS